MMSVNLSDIAISNFNGADYCCIINRKSKDMAINLFKNFKLTEKITALWNIKINFNISKWVKKF